MLINVIIGGRTVRDARGIPSVVGGQPSVADTSELTHQHTVMEDDNERAEADEYYWPNGELAHRSVHVHLKTGIFAEPGMGEFSKPDESRPPDELTLNGRVTSG